MDYFKSGCASFFSSLSLSFSHRVEVRYGSTLVNFSIRACAYVRIRLFLYIYIYMIYETDSLKTKRCNYPFRCQGYGVAQLFES